MTAKSRRRKIEKKLKRSNDANPYPQDVRRPEEARGSRPSHIFIDEAIIRSASVVPEGEGLGWIAVQEGLKGLAVELVIKEVAFGDQEPTELEQAYADKAAAAYREDRAEAAVRAEASPDAASVFERGTASVPKQHFEGWLDEAKEDVREALFQDLQRRHQLFFKVMGNPNYVGSEPCYCELDKNHSTFI